MIIKTVQNPNQGLRVAKALLYKHSDKKTVLFLSGGTTPKTLYKALAKEKKLNVGAVGLVDERFGLPNHKNSNERMIRDTGLIDYLESKQIPFYPILGLHPKGVVSEFARDYEKDIMRLMSSFPKRIAIMGIGEDGHVAGLPAQSQMSNVKSQKYVTEINDFPGEFKERITLTFNALSEMDLLIILAFGSAKKKALNVMFAKGSEEEIPARFYTRSEITEKTILITDQKV